MTAISRVNYLLAKTLVNSHTGIIKCLAICSAGCARVYLNDEKKEHQFIIECSEQCHNKLAKEYWGEALIIDVLEYRDLLKKAVLAVNKKL